jgi:hypothetical protein
MSIYNVISNSRRTHSGKHWRIYASNVLANWVFESVGVVGLRLRRRKRLDREVSREPRGETKIQRKTAEQPCNPFVPVDPGCMWRITKGVPDYALHW